MSRTKADKQLILISVWFCLFLLITSIISGKLYARATAKLDFLEEARQAATVGAVRDALERGTPWVQKHFMGESELRIWQSNLEYLSEQPRQALIPSQMKKSVSSNTKDIFSEYNPGGLWEFILIFSIGMLPICAFITLAMIFDF